VALLVRNTPAAPTDPPVPGPPPSVSRASSTIATCAIDLVVREIVSRRRESRSRPARVPHGDEATVMDGGGAVGYVRRRSRG
jgi:hypothetical protein